VTGIQTTKQFGKGTTEYFTFPSIDLALVHLSIQVASFSVWLIY